MRRAAAVVVAAVSSFLVLAFATTAAHAAYPGPTTTGVPDGVELRPSGSLKVTRDGTVIENLHVSGTVTVTADDVVIRNTLIERTSGLYPIKVTGERLLVEDSEIDGNAQTTGVGLLGGDFTLRRVDIHGVVDGPRIEGDDVLIEDSWIHDLNRIPGGHHDVIQIRRGTNVTIRGNNLDAYHAATSDPMNAAIQIGTLNGPLRNLLVEDNRFNGGNYTINAKKGGPDPSVYRRNVFGRDFRYGVLSSGPGVIWDSTNVYEDDGRPVR